MVDEHRSLAIRSSDDDWEHIEPHPAPGCIADVPLTHVEIQELLGKYNSLRVLLLGLSNTGKSSLTNAMFQDPERASVGTVHATTENVDMHMFALHKVAVCVYDTPGFKIGDKSKNKKLMKNIKQCKCVDIIFLCFSLNSSSYELEELIKIVSDSVNKQVWKKIMFVFTKANTVMPTGLQRADYDMQSYNDKVFDDLKKVVQESPTLKKLKITLNNDQFTRAGNPDPVNNLPPNHCDNKILYDDPERWIPAMLIECFQSSCWTDDAKAALLRAEWDRLQISTAGVSVTTGSALMAGGAVCLGLGVTATIAGPVTWSFSVPLMVTGGVLLAIGSGATFPTTAIMRYIHNKEKKQKKEIDKIHEESKNPVAQT